MKYQAARAPSSGVFPSEAGLGVEFSLVGFHKFSIPLQYWDGEASFIHSLQLITALILYIIHIRAK